MRIKKTSYLDVFINIKRMAALALSMESISAINPAKEKWTFSARIVRLCSYVGTMEMVLLDNQVCLPYLLLLERNIFYFTSRLYTDIWPNFLGDQNPCHST